MKTKNSDKNAFDALYNLLQMHKVKVTKIGLRNKLYSHPEFPSLSSLSDVISDLKIDNISCYVNPEQINELTVPAIVYLETENGFFAIIKSIKNNEIEWLHTDKGWKKENLESFNRKWTGIVLMIDAPNNIKEKEFESNKIIEYRMNLKKVLFITSLITLSYIAFSALLNNYSFVDNMLTYFLFFIKVVGLLVCVKLIIIEKNINESNFCKIGNSIDCEKVLNSKKSKLFNTFSLSKIGLIYFSGGILSLIIYFLTSKAEIIQHLIFINILSIPYTLFSLYEQSIVIKKYCLFCLMIIMTLWIETAISYHQWTNTLSIDNSNITIAPFLFVSCMLFIAKRSFVEKKEIEILTKQYIKVKFNALFINALLKQKKQMPPILQGMQTIDIGKNFSKNVVTMVINPTCTLCSIYYFQLLELIQTNDEIRANIIFAASNDSGSKIGNSIISLPKEEREQALTNWFKSSSESDWMRWFDKNNSLLVANPINIHHRWCELHGINNTPALFINSKELPDLYKVSDIPNILRLSINDSAVQ